MLPGTTLPRVFDLAHECRVDDEVPKRSDQRHVGRAEPAARLDVNTHLPAVEALALVDPCQVEDGVHGAV